MKDVDDKDIFLKMLENFNEEEMYDLCAKVCEKHLYEDSELYQWFHNKKNIGKEDDE